MPARSIRRAAGLRSSGTRVRLLVDARWLHWHPKMRVSSASSIHERSHASRLRRFQLQPSVDPLLQLGDVRNDADKASGLLQVLVGIISPVAELKEWIDNV